MEKWNEFMEKVKADEALQKELTQTTGGSGVELTKEQKEKIVEIAAKSGIELNLEGELSDEQLEAISGGRIRESDGKYDCYYDASYENAAVCVKCGSDRLKKNGVEFFWAAPLPYPYAYSVVTQCEECGYAWRYCSNGAISGEMYEKGYML